LKGKLHRRAVGIAPKLAISQPGDSYEQEADRVAAQVMRMSAPARIQRKLTSDSPAGPESDGAAAHPVPSVVNDVIHSGGGHPLDTATRAFFGPRFGYDLGQVRVLADSRAAQSAQAVNARAFTLGHGIYFGTGEYRPATDEGRRLLAHELTHVVQQRAGAKQIQRQLYPPVPIMIRPGPEPVEVNAVDARQATGTAWYKPWRYTGPITNFFRGDVRMTRVATMVNNVITFLNGRRMHRLNIMDHGNQNGVEIGDDWLATPADVATHSGNLRRLRGQFASSAFVHMQNCNAGQNRALICALASAFGVSVYAGTGAHNPLLGFNVGNYVRCDPDGTFNPNVGRPQTPTPPAPPPQPLMA
jgi:hypothetical protein